MTSKYNNLRIGLLGGSFNPAHGGHVHISREALKRLQLDEVWWLVSPQNPLKPTTGMAAFDRRLENAQRVASVSKRILVSDAEQKMGTRYTADTLRKLTKRFPRARFVWLMGADNLLQMSKWSRWTFIFNTLPVAVFARPTYSKRAIASAAARRFNRARKSQAQAKRLADAKAPAWVFLKIRENPLSATDIRRHAGI